MPWQPGFAGKGLTVEACLEVKSLKAQMRAAGKLRAKFVVSWARTNGKTARFPVRRMADGEQWRVDREEGVPVYQRPSRRDSSGREQERKFS